MLQSSKCYTNGKPHSFSNVRPVGLSLVSEETSPKTSNCCFAKGINGLKGALCPEAVATHGCLCCHNMAPSWCLWMGLLKFFCVAPLPFLQEAGGGLYILFT